MSIEAFVNRAQQQIKENAPSILAAMAVGGVASTGILAYSAGRHYQQQLIEATNILDPMDDKVLTGKEKFEMGWRRATPVLILGTLTATCVITGALIGNRRNAALMSALTIGQTAFREYREKAESVMGKAKAQKVVDEIAQDRVEAARNPEGKELVFLGDDKVIFFDTLTSRYFSSTKLDIEKSEVELNRRILNDMSASQNDWYDLLGIDRVANGDDVGWNNDRPLQISFSATVKEDKPVFAISYWHAPVLGFHKNW